MCECSNAKTIDQMKLQVSKAISALNMPLSDSEIRSDTDETDYAADRYSMINHAVEHLYAAIGMAI